MIRVVTKRSPIVLPELDEPELVEPALGNPLPLRRKVLPEEVFFGIDNSTAPVSVGTRTFPPSTASYSVIGRSSRTSLPSTLKNGCGAMLTVIRRSPGG